MAHFSFLLALVINGFFITDGQDRHSDSLFLDASQFIEEHFPEDLLHDLDNKCKFLLFQKLLQQRLESLTIFPGESEDLLLLAQIETLKSEGFTEEEFKKVKFQALCQLDIQTRLSYTEQAKVNAYKHTLEKIQLCDLSFFLATFLSEDPYTLRLLYPKPVHSDWIFDTTQDISVHFADNSLNEAPFFFINNPSEHIEPFYQLPLEEKEQKLIFELIRTIAEKNIWGLLFKKKEVEKLGKRVNVVHPMRFMGYILSEPKLKKWLKDIRHSSFKWDHFMDGFADRMKEESAKNNLMPYVPGMAHFLHVDQSLIMNYIENKDYIGLVKSLL